MTIPQLPPVARLRRGPGFRAVPVDPADLRTLHQMLVANIALGILNLALTLSR
jgi:hypothetical protein